MGNSKSDNMSRVDKPSAAVGYQWISDSLDIHTCGGLGTCNCAMLPSQDVSSRTVSLSPEVSSNAVEGKPSAVAGYQWISDSLDIHTCGGLGSCNCAMLPSQD